MGEVLAKIAQKRELLAADFRLSDQARADDLRAYATKVSAETLTRAEKVLRSLANARARTSQAWKAKLPQAGDDVRTVQIESEVRSLLRGMSREDRRARLVSAIEAADFRVMRAFYAGWGNAMSAVEVAQETFVERGVSEEQLPEADPQLLPLDEEAEAERERRVQESYGEVSQGVVDNTRELLFRDLWLRPALKPRDRSLVP